jgi:hypothetical protein
MEKREREQIRTVISVGTSDSDRWQYMATALRNGFWLREDILFYSVLLRDGNIDCTEGNTDATREFRVLHETSIRLGYGGNELVRCMILN